jgi:hypothetical protein
MIGEIFFNMMERQHPILGSSTFLMKRWKKYTIYSKSGSYVRTNYLKSGSYGWNGKENSAANFQKDIAYNRTNAPHGGVYFNEQSSIKDEWYQTASIYLYDYVTVTQAFYFQYVYTASVADRVPSDDSDYAGNIPTNKWNHREGTWRNSPNSIYSNWVWHNNSSFVYSGNDYIWPYNSIASMLVGRPIYGWSSIYTGTPAWDMGYQKRMKTPLIWDDGTYFEVVNGYPRNHFSHKRPLFSLFSYQTSGRIHRTSTGTLAPRDPGPLNPESMDITRSFYTEIGYYMRNRQTISTTIGQNGLEDGTLPVRSFQVGNLNLVQTDNVINH